MKLYSLFFIFLIPFFMSAQNNPKNIDVDWKTDKSKQIGSVTVFDPRIEDKLLTFKKTKEGFVDNETGSVWEHHRKMYFG